MWTAKCSCRLQAFAHLQASQGKYYEADATYGPLPNNTNRGDSDGLGFPDCPGPTTPRAVPLPPSTNHVTICPATPDSPARIGRKSMARRSGQSGSIQKEGNWYVVRYWKDVAGEEKRQRVYAKICPISGPGKLSASERERKAKEIIAASGVDTQEYFDKVVKQSAPGVTFRQQAETWLEGMCNRKRKPLAPSTIAGWSCGLDIWINPNIGDLPLASVNNAAMKKLVGKMDEGGLSPKSISNNVQIVKMVVASAVNEQGDELYPRKWNNEFIDVPVVNNQRQPSFTGDVVTAIIRETEEQKYRVLFALCASSGLRFGEALGIDIKNISPDGSNIKIVEKAWRSERHNFLKTENGKREIDLHPSMATMLREYMEKRTDEKWASKTDLLFASRNGKPLHQSNILRRVLHPILEKLGQPKCGVHAFRRFRNTYLRNFTSTPPGIYKFWMGHASAETEANGSVRAGETMSDRYDKVAAERGLRKEWAERAGLGFEIPAKILVIGRNGRKPENAPLEAVAVSA
jgi:integrase